MAIPDRDLAAQIGAALARAGYTVEIAHDGDEGEFRGATETICALVLDLGLSDIDGIEVLKHWRSAGLTFPVLILTARDAWSDKVAGFRAGADDYVLKPFRMDDVLLRLPTLIRRAAGHATAELSAGGLVQDTTIGLVISDGMPLRLTRFETRLLRFLMLHEGRVAALAVLGAVLIAVQVVAVRVVLSDLTRLARAVAQVRDGRAPTVPPRKRHRTAPARRQA